MSDQNEMKSRRELATRQKKWAQSMGKSLSDSGVTPNFISVLSIAFAGLAGLSYLLRDSLHPALSDSWLSSEFKADSSVT